MPEKKGTQSNGPKTDDLSASDPSIQPVATTPTEKNAIRTCSKPGCGEKHLAKGLCSRHYFQQREKAKAGAKQPRKKKDRSIEKPDDVSGKRISIDATLFDQLAEIARKEYRTPSAQAHYFVAKGIDAYRKGEVSYA